MNMIRCENLKFKYSNDVNFQFTDFVCDSNKSLLIIGPSGLGKTTLLHLLAGLLKAESGDVFINNQSLQQLSDKKLDRFRGEQIGIVFQKSHFVASLNTLENLELTSWLSTGKKNTSNAKSLLEQLGLAERMTYPISSLSMGQQQRLSIARAVINKPSVILADEPTSSLDDENCQIVADILNETAQEIQAALIVVSHDQRLKARFNQQYSLQ